MMGAGSSAVCDAVIALVLPHFGQHPFARR
jgi:hypothetical protein